MSNLNWQEQLDKIRRDTAALDFAGMSDEEFIAFALVARDHHSDAIEAYNYWQSIWRVYLEEIYRRGHEVGNAMLDRERVL